MDTPRLLKEEINQTFELLHDFAKWKLIVVSALSAAALGLGSTDSESQAYWLLLFVPYACAYVDLNSYQYLLKILVIAETLRWPECPDAFLREYETKCKTYREKTGLFNLGSYAEFASSLAFSIVAPAFCIIRLALEGAAMWKTTSALVSQMFGIGLIVFLYRKFRTESIIMEPPKSNAEQIA